MTVPKFTSVEQADAWFAQQAKEQDTKRIANEAVELPGPRWVPYSGKGRQDMVIRYSTARTSTGKFAVVVFRSGTCTYAREFVRRKDAKARAEQLYWERDKR